MQTNESYSPSKLVSDHFDAIIARIEDYCKTLLLDVDLKQRDIKKINNVKKDLVEKVTEQKQENLSKWNEKSVQDDFEAKWLSIINDSSLLDEQKIEKIKESILKSDCFFHSEKLVLTLWVTPFYVNKKNDQLLR
jgi:hypothetical protein